MFLAGSEQQKTTVADKVTKWIRYTAMYKQCQGAARETSPVGCQHKQMHDLKRKPAFATATLWPETEM